MTLPVLPVVSATPPAEAPAAASSASGDFDRALGAATAIGAALPLPPSAAPAPRREGEPLTLLLEGPWLPEGGDTDAGGSPGAAGEPGVVTLEQGLEGWLTRIETLHPTATPPGAAGDQLERNTTMSSTEWHGPAGSMTGMPAMAPSRSSESIWDATVRAVALARSGVASAATDSAPAAGEGRAADQPIDPGAAADAPPVDPAAGADAEPRTADEGRASDVTRGGVATRPRDRATAAPVETGLDAETLLREFAPAMRTIEIAGFPFPLDVSAPVEADEQTSAPRAASPAAPAQAEASPQATAGGSGQARAPVVAGRRAAAPTGFADAFLESARGAGMGPAAPDRRDGSPAAAITSADEAAPAVAEGQTGDAPRATPMVERQRAPGEGAVAASPRGPGTNGEWRLEWPRQESVERAVTRAAGPRPPTEGDAPAPERTGPRVAGWAESAGSPAELLRPERAAEAPAPVPVSRAADAAPRPQVATPAAPRPAAPPGAPPAPVARPDLVTLDLGDQFGSVGRLRLSIKGPSLRATIVPSDPELAPRLGSGLQDLTRSLQERGFADARVTVRQPAAEPAAPVPLGREPVALGRQPDPTGGAPSERGHSGGRQDETGQGQRQGGQRRERPASERQQRGRWA